ncbi:MAG: hypothetical protein K2X66_06785 [Cyanobacteria bacterium]|nr:hypothetical protein [Cyanobacteriota bacterium]
MISPLLAPKLTPQQPQKNVSPGLFDIVKIGKQYPRIWFLTAVVWLFMGVGVAIFSPDNLISILKGLVLGTFYQFFLMKNALVPLGKFQIVFSLTRMVLFAYLIVYIANFNFLETGVVICGFLSYKLVLMGECFFQCNRSQFLNSKF